MGVRALHLGCEIQCCPAFSHPFHSPGLRDAHVYFWHFHLLFRISPFLVITFTYSFFSPSCTSVPPYQKCQLIWILTKFYDHSTPPTPVPPECLPGELWVWP